MIFSLKILIMLRLVINTCKNIDKAARLKLFLNKFQYQIASIRNNKLTFMIETQKH